MKRLPAFLVGALTLGTVSLVRADAPAGQYQPFDGNDATVTDAFTKLTWSRAVLGPSTFLGAQGLCAASIGTHVPTLKELLTIVDESPHNYESEKGVNPYKYIDGSAFRNTPIDGAFWTSTPSAKTGLMTTKAFTVDFGTGGVVEETDVSKTHYVRCVK